MNRLCLVFNLLAVTALSSCYAFTGVSVIKNVQIPYQDDADRTGFDITLSLSDSAERTKKTTHKFRSWRFLTIDKSQTPGAVINNEAVELALSGRYSEAEFLLTDIIKDSPLAPALSNLGVVYEMSDNFDAARDMYLRAFTAEPGIEQFKYNFLYLMDERKP